MEICIKFIRVSRQNQTEIEKVLFLKQPTKNALTRIDHRIIIGSEMNNSHFGADAVCVEFSAKACASPINTASKRQTADAHLLGLPAGFAG